MKFKAGFALMALLTVFFVVSFAQVKPVTIPLDNPSDLQPRNVKTEIATYKGKEALRVSDAAPANVPDGIQLVILKKTDFEDGVIEVDLTGEPQANAGAGARGFVGIAFRVNLDSATDENPAGGHASPSWSPDGKRIAFEVSDFIFVTIWTIAVDGSDLKRIVKGSDPVYSADGGYIYFAGGHSGGGELLRIKLSPQGDPIGEPATVLGIGPGTFRSTPTISRDGKTIVYSVDRFASNLWTIPVSPSGDTAGPPSVFLPDSSQRNNLPRFSPDFRRIALNRWRPGMSADIWVADADGKNLKQVTNNPTTDSQASWLPGGDKLAFLANRDKTYLTLWAISLTTGREEPLLDLGEGVEYATLSPDGNQVAYNLIQNGIMNVWIATVRDGQRRQLTFDNEGAGFPCWSADGKWISYEIKHSPDEYLMLIPSTGGEPLQLTFDKGKSWPYSFSPSGNKIVFSGQRDGIWNIYSLSIDTKAQKRLTNYSKPNGFVRYPAWSPHQIVYENVETTGNIWSWSSNEY